MPSLSLDNSVFGDPFVHMGSGPLGTRCILCWRRDPFLIFTHLACFPLNQHIANYVCGIQTIGHRVIVSDVQESFIWVRYKRNENQLIIFADDTHPRWVTTACLLDYDTVAGADKFGNICVVSLALRTDKQRCSCTPLLFPWNAWQEKLRCCGNALSRLFPSCELAGPWLLLDSGSLLLHLPLV